MGADWTSRLHCFIPELRLWEEDVFDLEVRSNLSAVTIDEGTPAARGADGVWSVDSVRGFGKIGMGGRPAPTGRSP